MRENSGSVKRIGCFNFVQYVIILADILDSLYYLLQDTANQGLAGQARGVDHRVERPQES